jgi:hypothetical protein
MADEMRDIPFRTKHGKSKLGTGFALVIKEITESY